VKYCCKALCAKKKKKKKKKKLPNLTQTGTQQDNPHEIEDGEA